MPSMNTVIGRSHEYFELLDVSEVGAIIGFYRGAEISEFVVDRGHRTFEFVGITQMGLKGTFDCEALKPGEFCLRPGMVYRLTLR